jgi:hypothetical protein
VVQSTMPSRLVSTIIPGWEQSSMGNLDWSRSTVTRDRPWRPLEVWAQTPIMVRHRILSSGSLTDDRKTGLLSGAIRSQTG